MIFPNKMNINTSVFPIGSKAQTLETDFPIVERKSLSGILNDPNTEPTVEWKGGSNLAKRLGFRKRTKKTLLSTSSMGTTLGY